MKQYITLLLVLFLSLQSMVTSAADDGVEIMVGRNVISTDYVGNGVQWDPYQLNYGNGRVEISTADWQTLYNRLDQMKPGFIRIMINTSSLIHEGRLVTQNGFKDLKPLLDYCQSRNVTVMFGDWGGMMVYANEDRIDSVNLGLAAQYVDFLVNDHKYSCIKYYNLINEPNGDWSTTNQSYPLWARAMRCFHSNMDRLGLTDKVKMVGPDAAIWTKNEAWWIDSCANHLNNIVELYDIHTYPSKSTVNSGEYGQIIKAYYDRMPKGSRIVMGEIGLKFVEKADSLYDNENKRRIGLKPHAAPGDSQMFVYDHSYGTDMADALFQSMNVGFSGSLIWMLDDAMHSHAAPDKLKMWGFWNILGEEYFGGISEETPRPFYYGWSLLCRYIPAGCKVYEVSVSNNSGVKAVAVEHNGRYTLAVVNTGPHSADVTIRSDFMGKLKSIRRYDYIEDQLIRQGDCQILPNKSDMVLDLKRGERITLPTEGLVVYTNMQ